MNAEVQLKLVVHQKQQQVRGGKCCNCLIRENYTGSPAAYASAWAN